MVGLPPHVKKAIKAEIEAGVMKPKDVMKSLFEKGVLRESNYPQNISELFDHHVERLKERMARVADSKQTIIESDSLMSEFKCDTCNFSTVFKSTLEWHKRKIHGPNIRKFPCDKCKYSAGNEHRLRDHKNTVHERIKAFKCHLCDHAASNWSNMDKHIRVVHEKIKPFHCPKCQYSGSSRGNLECHIRSRHANQIVTDPESKAKLMKVVNEKIKPLTCPQCQYSASSRRTLEAHILNFHTNQIDSDRDTKAKLLLQATPRGAKSLALLQNTTKYENIKTDRNSKKFENNMVKEEVHDHVAPMQTVWLTDTQ